MRFVDIFEPSKGLYAVIYPPEETLVWNEDLRKYFDAEEFGTLDELERNIALWHNTEYLYDFFEQHKDKLDVVFWNFPSIEDAVYRTLDNADAIEDLLSEAIHIEILFRPLSDGELSARLLQKSKLKQAGNWLRLYAIKLEQNKFILTGGAIKLTRTMQACETNALELLKLEKVRNYLRGQGIVDADGFQSYMLD